MRILTYGMYANKLTGQDTFLINMNEHMSDDCIFDYVVIGNKCMHEDKVKNKRGEIFVKRENYLDDSSIVLFSSI